MNKLTDKLKDVTAGVQQKQEVSARRTLLEELFQDYYQQRRKLYQMNFIRGVFFGFGSVLGGTVVVALVVWLLTILIGLPVAGEYIQNLRNSLETS